MRFLRAMARGRTEATPVRVMISVGTVVFVAVALLVLVAMLIWVLG